MESRQNPITEIEKFINWLEERYPHEYHGEMNVSVFSIDGLRRRLHEYLKEKK